MRLPFLNRRLEIDRLSRALARNDDRLLVVYGRRRCGKSRLLREVLPVDRSVYYVADQRDATIQREELAHRIALLITGFDRATYSDWSALLETWRDRAPDHAWLCLDEFPYLVQNSPDLPSVIQNLVDDERARTLRLLMCGSSQRMMHGIVIDRTSPLYGRATEIVRVDPMPAPSILDALQISSEQGVTAYAVWGGLPRNWELAADYPTVDEAIKRVILDPNGVLYGEPHRLLLDDFRSAAQADTLLTLIGQGSHRLSEIAGRIGVAATNLSRPLQQLVDLGYVRRDIPFAESTRSTRRTFYRISDPFVLFWHRFVASNRSMLEAGLVDEAYAEIAKDLPSHTAEIWEELCRLSVPRIEIDGIWWGPAARWWGTGRDGKPLEIDVIAESLDGRDLLFGEAKWSDRVDSRRVIDSIRACAEAFPDVRGRSIHYVLFLKRPPARADGGIRLIGPEEVLSA